MRTMKVKTQKLQKMCKFENDKNCLQASQLENKIIHLNNSKIHVKSLRKITKNL